MCAGLPLLLVSVGALPASANPGGHTPTTVAQTDIDPLLYEAGRYIVVLAEQPIAMYDGGTAGLAPTKPQAGQKLDATRPEVQKYQAHLETKQATVAKTENVKVKRTFTAALNGFSADLSAEQALALAKDPAVLAVAPDTENAPDYSSTDFLGLSGENGSWNTAFGGQDKAGEGVVVGVIDTGYTPSSPFFAGEEVAPLTGEPQVGVPYRTDDGNIAMLKANGDTFSGECQAGVESGADFDGSACNSKVLSAHYFADDFLKYVAPENRAPQELLSPWTWPATARTPPARPPATPTSRPPSAAATWASPRAWRRPPSCPSTRSAGKTTTRTPAAAILHPPLRPSTRPFSTAWTC